MTTKFKILNQKCIRLGTFSKMTGYETNLCKKFFHIDIIVRKWKAPPGLGGGLAQFHPLISQHRQSPHHWLHLRPHPEPVPPPPWVCCLAHPGPSLRSGCFTVHGDCTVLSPRCPSSRRHHLHQNCSPRPCPPLLSLNPSHSNRCCVQLAQLNCNAVQPKVNSALLPRIAYGCSHRLGCHCLLETTCPSWGLTTHQKREQWGDPPLLTSSPAPPGFPPVSSIFKPSPDVTSPSPYSLLLGSSFQENSSERFLSPISLPPFSVALSLKHSIYRKA